MSLDNKKRQPEESRTQAAKQSKSKGVFIAAFLLLSNSPIRRSITITCPTFVFSSFTVFISNHLGLSCKLKHFKENSVLSQQIATFSSKLSSTCSSFTQPQHKSTILSLFPSTFSKKHNTGERNKEKLKRTRLQ